MSGKRSKINRIFNVAVAALTVYLAASALMLQVDISSYRRQLETLEAQYDDQVLINNEMRAILDQGTNRDYIIRMAREKLGLIFPDEKVFYNASGNQ
ncbi:MAG: hypothetical protein HFE45_11745 [Oscillospiraceae bacterium]|jgi:cell division protein FtsB|nr:hypothetical protein [Oscillospiraceae bacterium]